MKSGRSIFFIITFFISAGFYCQTGKNDSLPAKKDAPGSDTLVFKPQLRHGVKYVVRMRNGLVYTGFVVNETLDFITLEDRNTKESFELRRSEVLSIKSWSDRHNLADFTGENYHADSYMLAQSAFLFEPEKICSNAHWLAFENMSYAFNENWAVTANSLAFYPLTIGVKCAYKIDELNYVGGNVFGIANIFNSRNFFLGYGGLLRFTRGTSNHNFTVTGGLLGINSDIIFSAPSFPFYNLFFSNFSYCSRVSEKLALNLEGWYFPKAETALAGIGLKLVKNKNSCWTFGCYGMLNNFNSNITLKLKALPIPYFGLSQKF